MNKHFRKHHNPNLPPDRKGPAPLRTTAERRAYQRQYYREKKEAIKQRKNKKAWIRRGEEMASDAVDDVALAEKIAQDACDDILTLLTDVEQQSWRFNPERHSWPLVEAIMYDVGVQVVDHALFEESVGVFCKETFYELDPDERLNARQYALDALVQHRKVIGHLASKFHAMALLCTFGLDLRVDSDGEDSEDGDEQVACEVDGGNEGDQHVSSEVHGNSGEEASDVSVVSSGESSLSEGLVLTRSQRRARDAERLVVSEADNGDDGEVGVVTRSQRRVGGHV